MISRTYLVLMPDETPTTPLDILVESDPGTPDAPVIVGDAAYFEWRGRPLRIPVLAVDGTDEGFVPRLRLGFSLSILPWSNSASAGLPSVQPSESLLGTVTVGSGTPNLADPNDEAVIRLIGTADTAGQYYIVSLMCPEAKDEDRSNTGI
jgi:hypothetical protein